MFQIVFFSLIATAVSSFTPVPFVDTESYLGRWYQAYSDLAVTATFENSSYCVTADYGLYPNGTISVLNRERQYSIDGPERLIYGWADHSNSSYPTGELTVHLQTTSFPAPYWIFMLGPLQETIVNDDSFSSFNATQYQYSVVSDPFHLTLFVLARNLTDFFQNYNDTVITSLIDAGYTNFLNTPSLTVQEGCQYW